MYEFVLLLGTLVFLLTVFHYVNSGVASIFHPITYYLAFHGLVFTLRPLFKYFLDFQGVYLLYQFNPSDEVRTIALLVAILGLVVFYFTALLSGNAPVRYPSPEQQAATSRYPVHWVAGLLICAPLIAVSFRMALSQNVSGDDLIKLMQDAATRYTVHTETSAYIANANVMLGAFAVAIAWAFRFRLFWLWPLAVYFVARMAIGVGRMSFVAAAFSLLLLWCYDRRRKWIPLPLVAGGAFLIPAFTYLGQYRTAFADWLLGRTTVVTTAATSDHHFFDSLDFANLEFLEFIVNSIPDLTGTYDYFLNNLEIITAPIPRILWPGKPVGAPIQLYDLYDYGFPIGMTNSLPGTGWAAAGFIGVIIWCGLMGWLCGKLYNTFMNSRHGVFVIVTFMVLLPLTIQFYRDGVILSFLRFSLFNVLPIFVVYALVRLFPEGSLSNSVRLARPSSSIMRRKQR